jgi:hypothetical protein
MVTAMAGTEYREAFTRRNVVRRTPFSTASHNRSKVLNCKIALSWGHSIEATAARLMHESTKAAENGEAYALKTAEHADYAARVRNARSQGRPRKYDR